MSRLIRDGRRNLSRETKFSGVNGDKEIFPWSAGHVNRIGNLPVDLFSAICDDNNNNNNNCCSVSPQLPPAIGAPWGYCGRGFLLPVDYGSMSLQLTRLRRLNSSTLASISVRKHLNATVLQVTCTRVFFFNSCTGIRRRGKTCQYSSSSTNILYLNILYIVVGVGKIYGRHRGHREQSRE